MVSQKISNKNREELKSQLQQETHRCETSNTLSFVSLPTVKVKTMGKNIMVIIKIKTSKIHSSPLHVENKIMNNRKNVKP